MSMKENFSENDSKGQLSKEKDTMKCVNIN